MEINIKITEQDLQEHPEILHIIHSVTKKVVLTDEPKEVPASDPEEPTTWEGTPVPAEYGMAVYKAEPEEEPKEETPAPASEPETETEEPEKKYTIEDIRVALAEMRDEKGIKEARGLLLKFGANKVSDLKPEHYENFIKEAREV